MINLRYLSFFSLCLFAAFGSAKAAVDLVGFDGRAHSNPVLRAAYFAVSESQTYWDQHITLRFAVANQGSTAAGPFVVKFYLSPNTTIGDVSDYVIYTRSFSSLPASNVSWITDQPVFLPSVNPFGSGTTYYVGMVIDADGQVAAEKCADENRGDTLAHDGAVNF